VRQFPVKKIKDQAYRTSELAANDAILRGNGAKVSFRI